MAHSIIRVPGNGTSNYAISFTMGFNSRDEVQCQIDDEVDGLGDPVYTDLTWINDGLVTVADGPYDDTHELVFTRTMDKEELIHDYDDGEPITEPNLDDSNRQAMMSVHEVLDGRFTSPFQQDVDMGGYKIINMGAATDPDDAVTFEQTETVLENIANIEIVADNIADVNTVADNIADISAVADIDTDVTTVAGIADDIPAILAIEADIAAVGAIAADIEICADNIVAIQQAPTEADAAAASAVDAAASAAQALAAANGLKFRTVRLASTFGAGNITLSGAQTIDSVSAIAGDRVLLRFQTDTSKNGIWVVASGAWSRATDSNTWAEIYATVVLIEEGTGNADKAVICTSNQGGTLESTAIAYADWNTAIFDGTITNAKLAGSIALTKLATQAANTILGEQTGSTAVPTAIAVAANKFLARSSSGNIAAKDITDFALGLLDDADAATMRNTLGVTGLTSVTKLVPSGVATSQLTGIPAGVKRVTINFFVIHKNTGTDDFLLQIGPSGGVATTGYVGSGQRDGSTAALTTGISFNTSWISGTFSGTIVLNLVDASSNQWAWHGSAHNSAPYTMTTGGCIALAGALERLLLTGQGGSAGNFNGAGSWQVTYE